MRISSHKGFTLVEMLVVITIVGILAGLSIPVISSANVKAQKSKCLSNMRQIGLAMMTYAGENDYQLPETSHTTGAGRLQEAWITILKPYLANVDDVRICPADPLGSERLAAGGTSYILNSILFTPETDRRGRPIGPPPTLLKINNPAQTMMAFVISEQQSTGLSTDHTHSDSWNSWGNVTRDISPDRFTTSEKADHSVGTSNYLFADGHVQSIKAQVIKARVDSGENIALLQ
ncbi:MAG: type II secretion system protein [Verrucomicrobiota bacterium]